MTEPDSETSHADGSRPLGLWMATALVVGSMIGSGVFLLPAALAPYGAASLVGWGITLCGALLLAATFAKLAVHWPCTGGPYAYVRRSFGDAAGFGIAWSYWISIWSGMAGIAVAFAGSMGAIFPALTATPMRAATCALAALWLCTLVNLVGLRQAGLLQVLATTLKLLPLLLFGIAALWFVDAGNYIPFNPTGDSLPHVAQVTVILTMWAFAGLEVATVPAGAIRDAKRTIPRATLLGTLLAGIATILACTVVIGLVPTDILKDSGAPMAEAAASGGRARLWASRSWRPYRRSAPSTGGSWSVLKCRWPPPKTACSHAVSLAWTARERRLSVSSPAPYWPVCWSSPATAVRWWSCSPSSC